MDNLKKLIDPLNFSGAPSLEEMPELMESAKRKAQEERLLPRVPMSFTPSMSLMMQLFFQREKLDKMEKEGVKEGEGQVRQTFIGNETHFSSTPLGSLKPILLRDMHIRQHHKGYYLLCRIMSPPGRLVAVSFGVEDSNGWSQLVSVYNFPGTYNAKGRELDTIFPLNTVIAIREPYCKMALTADHSHIRVDAPSDIVIMEPGDPLLSNLSWVTGDRQLPVLSRSAAEWKVVADGHFRAGEYFVATVAYSYALRRNSTLHTLRLNRALAHLRLGNFAAALRDTQVVLERPNITQDERIKALYRSAQAEYGQEQYEDAKKLYEKCLEISSDLSDARTGISNAECRIQEQSKGIYDWARLLMESEKSLGKLDISDFTGPIEIVSMEHRGGGRGVKATRDINPGELLVVSKPFAASIPGDSQGNGLFLAFNFITDSINDERHYMVHQEAIYKAGCQASASAIYNLYGGEGFQPGWQADTPILLESPLHFSTDIDAARIHAVCSLNQFGFNTGPRTASFAGETGKEKDPKHETALYLLPSYFNHSCAPNAGREQFGEVMVVRAFMKIAKGEEVTITYHSHGTAFATRKKNLQKWIQDCDCNLCQEDRKAGVQTRRQRRVLLEEISNPKTSISRIRNLVKQLDGLYSASYGSYRVQASDGHHVLADRLEKLVFEYPFKMVKLYEEAIQEEIAAIEALQIKVVDKKMSKTPKSKARSLPISTDMVPYNSWRVEMLCIMITACFLSLGVEWRAERWLAAAIWTENARSGGGMAIFKRRYTGVLQTLLDSKAQHLLDRVERSNYDFLQ